MERMLATLANEMSRYYEITVITAFNGSRGDGFLFVGGVHRVDLGIDRTLYPSSREQKRVYKKELATLLQASAFDICVSLGSSEMKFLPEIKDGSKKVFWFHFALNYDIETCHLSGFSSLDYLIGKARQLRRIRAARKYDKVVVLSKADCRTWQRYLRNVTYIYNPLTIRKAQNPDYAVMKAIAVGRIDRQKGFDYLVAAWKNVHDRFPQWQLDIYGGGSEENVKELNAQIEAYGLSGIVFLKGRCNDMAKAYAEHSLMILSSRYEGFVLVLLEASACGLPLVSFDCKHGPAEIIDDGRNGYLVRPVGNIQGLADAICKMISDENLRRKMGEEAERMSAHFSLDKISAQWRMLFDNLMG
jgi:glycosyltransferase involved in cell wall biosynthesis